MGEEWPREVKSLVQEHTAGKQQRQDLNPGNGAPGSCLSSEGLPLAGRSQAGLEGGAESQDSPHSAEEARAQRGPWHGQSQRACHLLPVQGEAGAWGCCQGGLSLNWQRPRKWAEDGARYGSVGLLIPSSTTSSGDTGARARRQAGETGDSRSWPCRGRKWRAVPGVQLRSSSEEQVLCEPWPWAACSWLGLGFHLREMG